MSQEPQDAVVGRVAREHADTVKQVAILDAEVGKYRQLFARLVNAFGDVDYIMFDDESLPIELQGTIRWGLAEYKGSKLEEYRFSSADIDGQQLKKLCAEIRAARARRDQLAAQLKNLGL